MKKQWRSPIYSFFKPDPTIEYIGGRHTHVFHCAANGCQKGVRCFLDKGNRRSTGNMCKHMKACWGEDVLQQVLQIKDHHMAHKAVKNYKKNGTITTAFEWKGKGKVKYSHLPLTKMEMR